MKVTQYNIERTTIATFADKHGLEMEVHERERTNPSFRFYAHFTHCEIKEGSILEGTYGEGATPQQAIDDYASQIECRLLVVDAMRNTRREIKVPKLTKP